jgi:hypothetical protein
MAQPSFKQVSKQAYIRPPRCTSRGVGRGRRPLKSERVDLDGVGYGSDPAAGLQAHEPLCFAPLSAEKLCDSMFFSPQANFKIFQSCSQSVARASQSPRNSGDPDGLA